jgi:hypothetical protein
MIAIRRLSWFFLFLLAAALTACGSDDDDGPAPGTGGGSGGGSAPAAVELEQLAGTWAGPFDGTVAGGEPSAETQTLHFTITGDQIDFHGFADDRTGTIEKATEVANAFRIQHSGGGGDAIRGMLLAIAGDTQYLLFVQENGQFAAMQKIADGGEEPTAPEYAQTDLDGTWSGLSARAADAQFSPLLQTTSSAACEAADAASDCTVTIDEAASIPAATRNATGLALTGSGRWIGTYGDAGTAHVVLTHDKGFAGAVLCEDAFPQSCDLSAWTRSGG